MAGYGFVINTKRLAGLVKRKGRTLSPSSGGGFLLAPYSSGNQSNKFVDNLGMCEIRRHAHSDAYSLHVNFHKEIQRAELFQGVSLPFFVSGGHCIFFAQTRDTPTTATVTTP